MRNFKRFSQGDSVHGYRCQDHRVALLKADNKPMHYGLKLLKAQEADDEPQCCQCQCPLDLSTHTLSKYINIPDNCHFFYTDTIFGD